MVTEASHVGAAPDIRSAAGIGKLWALALIVAASGFAGLGYELT